MKRKTKNFIEDLLIVSVLLVVVYVAYYFISFEDDKKVEYVVSKDRENIVKQEDENNFFNNLYEDIKNIFSSKQDEEILKKAEDITIQEKNTQHLEQRRVYSQYRSLSEIKKESNEQNSIESNKDTNTNENIENITSNINLETTPENKEDLSSTNDIEAIKNSSEESINQENQTTQDDNPTSKNETILEQKETLNSALNTDTKSTQNIESSNIKNITNIDDFFVEFEKIIYASIKNSENISKLKSGDSINIRVTILKDGSFEQLTFVNGNLNNFNIIKEAIEKVFPLEINSSLKGNFPRYYRMKIVF